MTLSDISAVNLPSPNPKKVWVCAIQHTDSSEKGHI